MTMTMMNGMTNHTKATHHVFHAMGTSVHITIVGISGAEAKKHALSAEQVFRTYDERFSRFKDTSELHKLNISDGKWVPVSLEMFQILKKCVSLSNETDGAFDASVGKILASYGYGLPKNIIDTEHIPTYNDIEFNDRELSVKLALGQVLETACIIKGMAIDSAGDMLSGILGFMINAGGDILTHGDYENNSSWNVAIQSPQNIGAVVSAITIRDKGMATSGTYQTKGINNGKEWHHLINMRTRKPTDGFVSATIVAPTCEEADIEASLAILLSPNEAMSRLSMLGLPYFLVSRDGTVTKNSTFEELEVPISSIL